MLIIVGPVNTSFTRSVKQSPILRWYRAFIFAPKNAIKGSQDDAGRNPKLG
jgi:hypothetical protein